MIYVKSLLCGLGALILYGLLAGALGAMFLFFTMPKLPDLADGSGFVGASTIWIPTWPLLGGAVVVFAAVFYWSFRRFAKQNVP